MSLGGSHENELEYFDVLNVLGILKRGRRSLLLIKAKTLSILDQYDVNSLVPIEAMTRKTGSALRAAVYTMLGIVASYLVSNSLHLVLTVLER